MTHPLQTKYWQKFRKEWGNETLITKWGFIVFTKVPFFSYKVGLFLKGPKPTKKMVKDLAKIAKKENAIYIKLEPNTRKTKASSDKLKSWGLVPGKTLFAPSTFVIDLTKSEEELLKSFSSKTRYNIRLAERKGVVVQEDNSDNAFEKYLQLMRETVQLQGFYAHTEKYHRLMWRHLHRSPIADHKPPVARLLTATHDRKIITTWIVFVWGDTLYYPYGARSTDPKYRNLMANNLMMWEAVRYGKKLGLSTFDLWGREPGKGFTKFKEGYNPQVVEFLGTWDLPTSPLYWPFRVFNFLRWLLLRTRSKLIKPNF